MKQFVKQIINEARVQRTIDPKIWASMSSMSSKNRATKAADVSPMRKDLSNLEVLLQKYVAGLLTIKAPCPATVDDITDIQSYQNFGNAYINAGGSLAKVQKLYVENGGTFDGEIADDEPTSQDYPDYEEADNEPVNDEPVAQDYPSYDEAGDESTDDIVDEPKDYPSYETVEDEPEVDDDIVDDEPINDVPNKGFDKEIAQMQQDEQPEDYPEYDEVETETFGEKYANPVSLKKYFETVGKSLRYAKAGDFLVWDENEGLILSQSNKNAIAKCVINTLKTLDKKPKFMLLNTTESKLGNPGNNDVYDSYYFKKLNNKGRLDVQAGSTYYYQEELKGNFYTNILSDNGNSAAASVKKLVNVNNIIGLTDMQQNALMDVLVKKAYLPTLPELTHSINILPKGRYWTASVADKGDANIMLEVDPDKIYRITDPNASAKVVAFITF